MADSSQLSLFPSQAKPPQRRKRAPEWEIWCGMIQRTTNPKAVGYPNYGGRGIKVCPRWRKFKLFLKDMGPRPSPDHSLDRYPDNDGNYEKSNCRWATLIEQHNNTRVNRRIAFNGKTQTVMQWAREYGLTKDVLFGRLYAGWSIERALLAPVRSTTRVLEHGGRRMSIKEWAKELCIPARRISDRLHRGWPVELALTLPKEPGKHLKGR